MFPTSEVLAHLSGSIVGAARWAPAAAVALVFAIALLEAALLPARLRAKAAWAVAVLLCGAGAAGLLRWENHAAASAIADSSAAEAAALHGLWSQWNTLAEALPPVSGQPPAASFDTPSDAVASLSAQFVAIKAQIAEMKDGRTARTVDPATTTRLADYLRQYGSYRVVVSCVPGDVEAFSYANQLVDILKAAGWDAAGPEATANVVDEPAMGVTVLVRDPGAADAARLLIDAFTKFNIAHRPGVTADYAIPDTATVELFVAKKP